MHVKKGAACKCQYILYHSLYWVVNLFSQKRCMRKIRFGIYCFSCKSYGLQLFIAVHVAFFDSCRLNFFLSPAVLMAHQKAWWLYLPVTRYFTSGWHALQLGTKDEYLSVLEMFTCKWMHVWNEKMVAGRERLWGTGGESYHHCQQSWCACHHGCYVSLESITTEETFCRSHYGNAIRKYRQCCPEVDRAVVRTHIKLKFLPSEEKK